MTVETNPSVSSIPEAPVSLMLDFSDIAQTQLPCRAKVPSFLVQYKAQTDPLADMVCRDLLMGIDGIDLERIEVLAHHLAELGVFLVPIPLAPQHDAYSPTNDFAHRSWAIPEEATILDRAKEICHRQVAGFVQLFYHTDNWKTVPWESQPDEATLRKQILDSINRILCRD